MNVQSIVGNLKQGTQSGVQKAVDALFNFANPLSERQLQSVRDYYTAIEDGSQEGPFEDASLLVRPETAIPRSVVFNCIISSLRMGHVNFDQKLRLAKDLLPSVVHMSSAAISAKEVSRLSYVARKNANTSVGNAALKALEILQANIALVDNKALEESLGVVTDKEWGAAFQMLLNRGDWRCKGFARCVEHVLAAFAVLKESTTAEECDVSTQWSNLTGRVLVSAAEMRIRANKKDVRGVDRQYLAQSHKGTLVGTPSFEHLKVALSRIGKKTNTFAATSLTKASAAGKYALVSALLLSAISPAPVPIAKETIIDTLKNHSGVLVALLGDAPAPNVIPAVEGVEDLLTYLFYTLGLSTTTWTMVVDIISLLQALPRADVHAFLVSKIGDLSTQILNPFVTNSVVFTSKRAEVFASGLARALCGAVSIDSITSTTLETVGITAECWPILCSAALSTVQNKCRSGDDRVGVLAVFSSLLKTQAFYAAKFDTVRYVLPDGPSVMTAVKSSLECGAVKAMGHSWEALSSITGASDLADGHIAVKNMAKNEDSRRMCLIYAGSDYTKGNSTWRSIQEDAPDVTLFQPDALMSLRFLAEPKTIATVSKAVSQAASVSVLEGTSQSVAAATAAINAAKVTNNYLSLAGVLAFGSGEARKVCRDYVVGDLYTSLAPMKTLWESLIFGVLHLNSAEKPASLADVAATVPGETIVTPPSSTRTVQRDRSRQATGSALDVIATGLLRHSTNDSDAATIVPILAEVLMACGHDLVVGEDYDYFKFLDASPIHARGSSLNCSDFIFQRVFHEHGQLLEIHGAAVAVELCKYLTHAEHIASAAGRGLALLLTRYSARRTVEEALKARAAAAATFNAILEHLKVSNAFFAAQSPLDAVLSADNEALTTTYMNDRLREQGLMKEPTKKLSKGMTEEDLEVQNIKEAKALVAGRMALAADMAKRRAKISQDVRKNLSPFFAIRTIGLVAPTSIEGLSAVYPYLHELLVADTTSVVVRNAALDACIGLLEHTPMKPVARQVVAISTRLASPTKIDLDSEDIADVEATAAVMRQGCPTMLPPALFTVLHPFIKGAFKAGNARTHRFIPAATQHQLLSILSMNTAQPDILLKSEACSLYLNIIPNFPGLFRSVISGLSALVAHCTPEQITPIIRGSFLGGELQKEAAAAALSKFTYFNTFRRAAVVAYFMSHDTHAAIIKSAKGILKSTNFTIEESDADEILSILAEFGVIHHPLCLKKVCATTTAFIESCSEATRTVCFHRLFKTKGVAPVAAIEMLASLLNAECTPAALSFLCDVIEDPTSSEAVLKYVLTAGRAVLATMDKDLVAAVAPGIQPRLEKTLPKTYSSAHRELFNAIAVVWLTSIACMLQDVVFLRKTVEQQYTVLEASNSSMVHDLVQESIKQISGNSSMKCDEKLNEFAERCLLSVLNSGNHEKKKAFAKAFVGVCQGLGLKALQRFSTIKLVLEGSKGKQLQRSGVHILIGALAVGLGHKFDAFALMLVPTLLEGVAEKDAKVSECASDASKDVMGNMSEAALRQLIPRLIEGLESSQTKKRTPALNFIGYVAFCSPKQLAQTLPQIMIYITQCLFDANSSVENAAFTALKRVAGVVSNKEIQDHVDTILLAMRNPTTETETALDALLYTRFVTSVDPASLALVIPVILRGLVENTPSSKGKASQIVGAMVHLVADPRSLLPYADELLRKMQFVAESPENEVRTTSAKAIGTLVATIRDHFLDEAFEWCFTTLGRAQTGAVKAGGAQVLVEIAHQAGKNLLFNSIPRIDHEIRHGDANVRDAYLHLMIYAPSTLTHETFQEFLPLAFPWVLVGLSDVNERVRVTALTAGSNIIGLFGSRNLPLVLNPILDGVVSEDTNQRQSSLMLMTKLVIHLVTQIKRKMRMAQAEAMAAEEDNAGDGVEGAPEEDENEADILKAGEVRIETARDAERRGVSLIAELEKELGEENFIRVLAALHVGRNESSSTVRQEVTAAWQVSVASARKVINKVFTGIVNMLVKFASSNNIDCVELASKSVDYTCTRLNENIERFIQLLGEQYKIGTKRHQIGALVCMSEIIPHAEGPRVMAMGGSIVACVLPALQSEDEEIRSCAGILFERVSKKVGSRLIESVVESQIDISVLGVIEVIKVRPAAALAVVFKVLERRETLTSNHMDLIVRILESAEEDNEAAEAEMPKYFDACVQIILRAIKNSVEGSLSAMETLSAFFDDTYCHMPIPHFLAAAKHPATKHSAVIAAVAYAQGVSLEDPANIGSVYRILIGALADGDERVSHAAAKGIVDMGPAIDQRVINETLDDATSSDVSSSRRAAGKYCLAFLDTIQQTLNATAHSSTTTDDREFAVLGFPKLFDTFQSFYMRTLEHGLPAQRTQAIDAVIDLLQYTPLTITSAAVSTISGKCSKALFVKQDGTVVAAILRLSLSLLGYPAGGKERMVESTLAIAMIGALLCDNPEARTLVHRIVITILKRNPLQAQAILGSIVTKRSSLDTPLYKSTMCRLVSVVMRHANLEKKVEHSNTLLALIRPMWATPETVSLGVAAGSAIGALCMNAAVSDEVVADICKTAVNMAASKSTNAQGGIAAIFSLCTAAPTRIDDDFRVSAAKAVTSVMGFVANDRLAALWIMRCAMLFSRFEATKDIIPLANLQAIMRKVMDNDELLLSAAKAVQLEISTAAETMICFPDKSNVWTDIGFYDADVEDESQSSSFI